MFSIHKSTQPKAGLLNIYVNKGAYTDCFVTEVDGVISFEQFVIAFYTTKLFKLERLILKWLVAKPSTDEQVDKLARGEATHFAAWRVEDKSENQLLLCDYQGKTRSWLMVEVIENNNQPVTRLYFGSAVVANKNNPKGEIKFDWIFRLLSGFHTLYSILLLASAKFRLIKK